MVCVVSVHSNKEENMCVICVSFLSCICKKLKENGKVHFHWALSSLAVYTVVSNVYFYSLFPISGKHLNLINFSSSGKSSEDF